MAPPGDDSSNAPPPGKGPKPMRKPLRATRRRALATAAEGGGEGAIPRRGDRDQAPLSFSQERLWFLEQLNPGSPLFNIPVAARLRGPLDAALLEHCLTEVARRHDTLRTHFEEREGVPTQVVAEPGDVTLHRHELASEDEILGYANAEARRPFDLTVGPLWRATLVRLGDDDHLLLLVLHHGIAEGAGVANAFAEIGALYRAFDRGRPSPLPELPIQYADFAVWQRERARSGELAKNLDYWKQQLADPPTLQLPTDRPRPAVRSSQGRWQWIHLDRELTGKLRALGERERATLFMLLLAVYKAFLHRYSRQSDIAIGAPISQRDRPELHGLIGFFVNAMVLRTDLSGDPSYRELVSRVRNVALDAYAHAEMPFEMLVEELQPDRDPSQNPLFQVMFELPTDPMPVLDLPGIEPARILGPLELNTGTSKADLAFFAWEEGDRMIAAGEFNTDLFDAATAERMLANFETLLKACLADPDAPLSTLPAIAPAERRTLLETWNDTASDHPRERCIHELVEEQAATRPDALAVSSATEQLTYGEWNRRANRLAHYLRSKGVGPDTLVGVLMERTPEMVTCLLAIMKAGGAYVPLDPANPPDRQALMLEDAGVPVLLVQESTLPGVPDLDGEVLCVDRDRSLFENQPDTDPENTTGVEDLAYVIFTSGSTGRPKGVQIPHRGLLNLVFWHRSEYEITPDDRGSLIAGLAFDASVWELWPYLTAGASMHLPDEAVRTDPASLLQWLADTRVTVCFVPTPLAEAALEGPCPREMPLRAMLTGGDKLHHPPRAGLPFELINHYGPTESTVVATFTRVPAGTESDPQPSIGVPIKNVQVYLLDDHMQPVPIGVPGELHVGGESLARGYHGRPDLTEERFVPSPFRTGERLYKTGDLARYAADGSIEFLGRIDHQVKVRGFRIELGEIEVQMAQHASVRECVVLARTDGGGPAKLVGYYRTEANADTTSAELRTHLADKLPDYMVPTAFVAMDEFPLTANGKIDRNALPEPEDRSEVGADYVAPENETQDRIAGVWKELLGVDQVGIHDNFFDLGGHSMLIVQLHRKLNAAFDGELSVAEVFQFPTVATMARHLSRGDEPKPALSDRAEQRKAAAGRQRRRRERRKR